MSLALVSDAGTPLVSDPGFRLVRACHREEIQVRPIPGPCAAVAAVSIAGLPTERVLWVGFPPKSRSARTKFFEELRAVPWTLVLFLSPHSLEVDLESALEILGNREALLVREMTKIHETSLAAPLSEILSAVETEPLRGEFTLVVAGCQTAEAPVAPSIDVKAYVEGLIHYRKLKTSQAVRQVAAELKVNKKQIYQLAIGRSEE
jgi:16S rRNA (cytidine1402-2'-O)-methyltransferase